MAVAFVPPGYRSTSPQELSATNAKIVRTEEHIEDLQDQLDRLLLITESMWFILKDKLKIDDAALIEMMKQVDLKDGKLDGKATPKPELCPNCNHTISLRTGRCLYCGAKSVKTTPF